ncbi:MAG: tetratricopeptide repeat protein [Betaproteobacteria bacterium]|nr:tetratricopeptide repeat protein [Betaproteobacteria bacterium]
MGAASLRRLFAALSGRRAEPAPVELIRGALECHHRGETDAAIDLLDRATRIAPADAEAYFVRGLLRDEVRPGEGVDDMRLAVQRCPGVSRYRFALGEALRRQGACGEAIDQFEAGVDIDPDDPERWAQLGDLCLTLGRFVAAEGYARRALDLDSGNEWALHLVGQALRAQGRSADALETFRLLASRERDFGDGAKSLLLTCHYSDDVTCEQAFEWHREFAGRLSQWGARGDAGAPWEVAPAVLGHARRMRIGYVSPDLGQHVVSFFLEPVLRAHDRREVEVFVFDTRNLADAQTARMRDLVEHWQVVSHLDDATLAETIRACELDAVVDLSGHTAGQRLGVFARRVAPVQLTWLGYPGTTGIPAIDYRLTDTTCDPVGLTDALHTEKLWRLPGPFLCYGPRADSPALRTHAPREARGYVTFGSFSNFAKVSDTTLRMWADVLARVPAARLLLKSRGLDEPSLGSRLRERFAALGGDAARLDLEGFSGGLSEHLARYGDVDIALDTYPYHGTTTTCEALWMGVPVVTLAGRSHVSRVGASLLASVGHAEWVASSAEEYVRIATALATGALELPVGSRLREQMRRSRLCDGDRFTRALESGIRQMLEQTSRERARASAD